MISFLFLSPTNINTTPNHYAECDGIPLSEENAESRAKHFLIKKKKKKHAAVMYVMRVSADRIIYHYSCDG